MLNPPPLRRLPASLAVLIFLPVLHAQFISLTPSFRTAGAAPVNDMPGAAELFLDRTAQDDFDGSCGTLDQGFGTYLAPRGDPAPHRLSVFYLTSGRVSRSVHADRNPR